MTLESDTSLAFLNFFLFCDQVSVSLRLEWSGTSRLTATSASQVQSHSLASPVAGITGTRHHAQLIFVFLVEMGFHHVDQDGLDLLTS